MHAETETLYLVRYLNIKFTAYTFLFPKEKMPPFKMRSGFC